MSFCLVLKVLKYETELLNSEVLDELIEVFDLRLLFPKSTYRYTYMRKYTFVSVSWAIYLYVYIAPFNIYNCILTLRTIIRRYIYKNTNYFPVGPNVLGLGLYSGMGWMKFEKKGKGVAVSLRFESPAVILIIRPQNFLSSHEVIINLNFPIHTRIIADWMSFSKSHNSIS